MFKHILIPTERKDRKNPDGPPVLTSRMVYQGENPDGQSFQRSLAGDITALDRFHDMVLDVYANADIATWAKERANGLDDARVELTRKYAEQCKEENRTIPVPLSRKAKAERKVAVIGSIERELKVA